MCRFLFTEYNFSKGQENIISIPFFIILLFLSILFFRKNPLSLYWNFKIGFNIPIILITLTSLSFSSTFLENFSSVFLTPVI